MKIINNRRIKGYMKTLEQGLFFLGLSIFYCFQSPLNPWEGADVTKDSGVFQYVAYTMHKGMIPYRDTFDHKGPLLYIINWLGQCILSYRGVWFIEVLFLTVTFGILYKIARLFAGQVYSYVTVVICSSLLFVYFDQGNFAEEYALPFIAAALYIFLDYFFNEKITIYRLIVCGGSFGCVLLLRPNMIAVWVVFCVAVLIKEAKKDEWKNLMKFLFYFILGLSITIAPIMIWLAVNGAIKDFWFDYFTFNTLYSSSNAGSATWSARIRATIIFMNNYLFLISSCVIGFFLLFRKNAMNWTYAVCILCNLFFITISGRAYGHYGMILIPLYIYPIASLERIFMLLVDNKEHSRMVVYLVASVILIACALPDILLSLYGISTKYDNRNVEQYSETTQHIVQLIRERTNENEYITVYGNWDFIYTASERLSASKYSYQFPISEILPVIKNEYFEELAETMPCIVVIESGKMDQDMQHFLGDNGYEMLWQDGTDGAVVYDRQ